MLVAMVTQKWTRFFSRKPSTRDILIIRAHSQNFSAIAQLVFEISRTQADLSTHIGYLNAHPTPTKWSDFKFIIHRRMYIIFILAFLDNNLGDVSNFKTPKMQSLQNYLTDCNQIWDTGLFYRYALWFCFTKKIPHLNLSYHGNEIFPHWKQW